MTQPILGSNLMLFVHKKTDGGSGSTTKATALACATSCKLDISASSLETSSKDSGKWMTKQATKLSWSGSSDNLLVLEDYESLFEIMIARTPIDIEFSTASNLNAENGVPEGGWQTQADGYKGTAIITALTLTASDGDISTYSVSFEGVSAISKLP